MAAARQMSDYSSQMSTEVDAVPNTPVFDGNVSFGDSRISRVTMDAYPGSGEYTSSHPSSRQEEQGRPTALPITVTDGKLLDKLGDLSLEESTDSSYGSLTPSEGSCSSMPSDNWESELRQYHDMMPAKIKVGYIDCLILYAETDREEAEKFRQHLINDIKIGKHGPTIAYLYDCAEFTALAGGQISHLDETVKRSTYIFMLLTKNFVQDKWMEFSSEACLMESIYNPQKQWCVVPVYTQRRNQGSFRVPMGLNSLKGINYYNDDQFYRNGVARLIADKVHVRVQANAQHKMEQKKWLEDYKRKQAQLRRQQQVMQYNEEKKTRELESWLRNQIQLSIQDKGRQMHHSSSQSYLSSGSFHSVHTENLKQVAMQDPYVANYLEDLRYGTKVSRQGNFTEDQLKFMQSLPSGGMGYVQNVPMGLYNQQPHHVRRSNSQASNLSGDMGMPSAAQSSVSFPLRTSTGDVMVDVPKVLWDKIENVSDEEKQNYVMQYAMAQNPCISQSASPSTPPQQYSTDSDHMSHYQKLTKGSVMASMGSDVNPRGDNSYMSQGQPGRENGRLTVQMSQDENLPNLSLFNSGVSNIQSMHPSMPVPPNAHAKYNDFVSHGSASATSISIPHSTTGSPGLPTVVASLEEDGSSMMHASSNHDNIGQIPVGSPPSCKEPESSDDEIHKQTKPKGKGSKYKNKYVTINIIQSGNVQVGDGNVVMGQQQDAVDIDTSGSEEDEEEQEVEEEIKKTTDTDRLTEPPGTSSKMTPIKPVLKEVSSVSPSVNPLVKPQPSHSEISSEGEFDAALSSITSASYRNQNVQPQICNKLPDGMEELVLKHQQSVPRQGSESPNIARVPPIMKTSTHVDSDSENDSLTKVKQVVDADETDVKTVYTGSASNTAVKSMENAKANTATESATNPESTKINNIPRGHNGMNVPCSSSKCESFQKSKDSGSTVKQEPVPSSNMTNVASNSVQKSGQSKPFAMSQYSNASLLFYKHQPKSKQSKLQSVGVPVGEDPLTQDLFSESNGFEPLGDSDEGSFVIVQQTEVPSTSSTELSSSGEMPKEKNIMKRFRNFFR